MKAGALAFELAVLSSSTLVVPSWPILSAEPNRKTSGGKVEFTGPLTPGKNPSGTYRYMSLGENVNCPPSKINHENQEVLTLTASRAFL